MCPIYELECEKCKNQVEVLVSYAEYKNTTYFCDRCHTELNKPLSKTTFRLYGEGFYSPNKKD